MAQCLLCLLFCDISVLLLFCSETFMTFYYYYYYYSACSQLPLSCWKHRSARLDGKEDEGLLVHLTWDGMVATISGVQGAPCVMPCLSSLPQHM